MKRQARVQRLIDRIGDIEHKEHCCPRKLLSYDAQPECLACDVLDELCDAIADFEYDELLGFGDDLVDAERIT